MDSTSEAADVSCVMHNSIDMGGRLTREDRELPVNRTIQRDIPSPVLSNSRGSVVAQS